MTWFSFQCPLDNCFACLISSFHSVVAWKQETTHSSQAPKNVAVFQVMELLIIPTQHITEANLIWNNSYWSCMQTHCNEASMRKRSPEMECDRQTARKLRVPPTAQKGTTVYSFEFAQSYFRPIEMWDWNAQSWNSPPLKFS